MGANLSCLGGAEWTKILKSIANSPKAKAKFRKLEHENIAEPWCTSTTATTTTTTTGVSEQVEEVLFMMQIYGRILTPIILGPTRPTTTRLSSEPDPGESVKILKSK